MASSSFDEIRAERLRKLDMLRQAGMNPYPADSKRTHTIGEFQDAFLILEQNREVARLTGRIRSLRLHGALVFADIDDGTGRIQALFKRDEMEDEAFDFFVAVVDAGDFIEVTGPAFVTKRGERSIAVEGWRMLVKTLRPIPDEWYGLKDEEERYRRRYLDMLLNDSAADIVRKRSLFWNTIRTFLLERGFIEVETPVLENTTGGAEARPFVTHHNAFDMDVYLRISAGELWQKKLLIAGFPKVFEIGRIFRNEGMSREHLQDYTQLEFYMAYADYVDGMPLIQELYRMIARAILGTTKFSVFGHDVDLEDEWKIYRFVDVIKEHYGIDALDSTIEEMQAALSAAGIPFDPAVTNIERGIDLLWKKVRKTISGPGFLIDVPVYLEPLAKRSREDSRVVERFQVLLAGSELGKAFSELNDPLDQRERFQAQQALRDAGDEEAQMADMDFVEALEYGMPPALGFGCSERLFSFLMGIDVREGQLFPLMRPKDGEEAKG
ncbi:MAG: lysine--tRNA ligase [Patescibacteria group bacterium]